MVTLLDIEEVARTVVHAGAVERIARGAVGLQAKQREHRTRRRGVHGRRRLRAVAHLLVLQLRRQVVGDLPVQLHAARQHVGATDARTVTLVAAEVDARRHCGAAVLRVRGRERAGRVVVHVACDLLVGDDDAQRETVRQQRDVRSTLDVAKAEVRRAELHLRLARPGVDHDGAAGRVLAEQGALRAAQHLDRGDVESVEDLRLHVRHDEVVDDHADRRLGIDNDVGLADATHRERSGIEAVDLRGGEVRDVRGEIADRLRRHLVDQVLVERRHGDRGRLQVGLATSRADDDLVEGTGIGRGDLLGERAARGAGDERQCDCGTQND